MARLALVFLFLSPAFADEPFYFGPKPGWSVWGGLSGGGSFGTPGGGGYLGGELSVDRISGGVWTGLYVDGAYDFGSEVTLVTAGPQLGYGLLGVDGGGALALAEGETEFGAAGRVLLSLGVFSLYGRYLYLLDSEAHVGQVGVLLKMPFWAATTGEVQ